MENKLKRYQMLSKVSEIRTKMIDEESGRLYDARLDFMVDRFFYEYTKNVMEIDRKYRIGEISKALKANPDTDTIAIWGCGQKADYSRRLFYRSDYADMKIVFVEEIWLLMRIP